VKGFGVGIGLADLWDNAAMSARPTLRIALFAIVAFVLGLVLARTLLAPRAPAVPQTENATVLPQPRAVPPLDLVDQDGRPLPPDFLREHWTVVFFGFTQCPDVCPTTLAVAAQMRRQLLDLPAPQQPRVLLVSVDPERDTPSVLKPYVTFFDPTFLAATGTLEATERAAAAFSVPFRKVSVAGGGYTLDHGAGLFFVSPAGAIAAYSSPPLDAATLARDFRKVVQYHEAASR
jgi:protein SCO1